MRVYAAISILAFAAGCNLGGSASQGDGTSPGFLQELWCQVGSCKVAARLGFHVPAVIYSSAQEVAIGATVTNPRGEVLSDFPVKLEVAPPSIAVVTQGGGLRCVSSGEAVLLGSAGPATHSEQFQCRVVSRISVEKHLRATLGEGALDPKVAVFDTDGQRIAGLAPSFSIADTQVLREDGGKLLPEGVGITRVTVHAGDRTANTLVTVVRQLKNEPLLLNDGHRINYALSRGNYEAAVKVQSGGSGYGVTLAWVGGDGCENHSESQAITSRCAVTAAGSLIIENPTTFGMGPAADGIFTLYEIP